MLLKVNPEKIREVRGKRTLEEIVRASNGAFSLTTLWKWEQGIMQPRFYRVPSLCKALGVKVNKIADSLV